jgi:TolB protein
MALGTAPAHAAFPGHNGKIVFTSNRDGNSEIYTINPDGTGLSRLTYDPAGDFSPVWSADGSEIAFSRSTNPGSGGGELFVMNADGSGLRRVTDDGEIDSNPSWSPDGTRLVFTSVRTSVSEIYTIGVDGTGESPIRAAGVEGTHPSWSPDGRRIVFTGAGPGGIDLLLIDADGSHLTNLSMSVYTDENKPAWSPDGSMIAFVPSSGVIDINAIGLDGRPITIGGQTGSSYWPAWSPDGTKIAFQKGMCSLSGCGDAIYTMNADGSKRTAVTAADTFNGQPDWGVAPPPAASPAAGQTRARPPACTLRSAVSKAFRRLGGFRLTLKCDQPATVSVKGTVALGAAGRKVNLAAATVIVGPAQDKAIRLRLARRPLKRVLAALRRNRKVEASFTATATAVGGTATATALIKKLKLR